MSATQGVLLRYAGGGEVYALPTAEPHVWRVAGVEVHVDLVAEHAETGKVIGLEALTDLASAAAHARRLAAETAPKHTGKSKRRVAAKGGR
jgi:hypothetical protein